MDAGDGKKPYGVDRRARGGRQLNAWVSVAEYEHLKRRARERMISVTAYLRELVYRDMLRDSDT